MQTRSSSKLARDQTSNPTSSTNPTPKGRIRRSSKQKVENSHFEEHLTRVATMTDNRTMAEMLLPPILAEQFELKHSLINMMISEQFFGLEKDNPHDHGQLAGGLKKNPRKFDESFHEAWERYKDLLRACPHHGFTELHELDTFYDALNPADQDSLDAVAGGNLLEKSPQDALTIIENKSKVRNSRSKLIASPVNAYDNHSSSELAKLTHAVNQQTSACLAAGGNTFPEFRDNIQGYVLAATGNYNQGNLGYHPQGVANQMHPPGFAQPNNFHLNELEKIKRMNDVSLKAMQNQKDMVKNELRNEMKTSIQTSLSNQTNEIKNMMASLLQMNTASTSGSGTLPGNTVANPKVGIRRVVPRNYNSKGERFLIASRFPTPSLACAFFSLRATETGNPTFSLHKEIASSEVTHEIHDSKGCTFLSEKLPDIDSSNDIHPHFDDDPLSGSTTYFAHSLLEEFADELALITYPSD
nr:reverse transcriptase domain-containing protein [Tanacetum cinerariifolium]